jgi:hypothetical protein
MKQKAQQIVVAIGLIISMLLVVAPVFSDSDPGIRASERIYRPISRPASGNLRPILNREILNVARLHLRFRSIESTKSHLNLSAILGRLILSEALTPKLSDSCRRAAPISCALATCENARNTNGYDCTSRKHQSINILVHLIRQNRSLQVTEAWQTSQNRVGYGSTYSAGFEPALPKRVRVNGEGGRSHA